MVYYLYFIDEQAILEILAFASLVPRLPLTQQKTGWWPGNERHLPRHKSWVQMVTSLWQKVWIPLLFVATRDQFQPYIYLVRSFWWAFFKARVFNPPVPLNWQTQLPSATIALRASINGPMSNESVRWNILLHPTGNVITGEPSWTAIMTYKRLASLLSCKPYSTNYRVVTMLPIILTPLLFYPQHQKSMLILRPCYQATPPCQPDVQWVLGLSPTLIPLSNNAVMDSNTVLFVGILLFLSCYPQALLLFSFIFSSFHLHTVVWIITL